MLDTDDYTPYGANGFGRTIYGVVSLKNGTETDHYEGTDYERAAAAALRAFRSGHGRTSVFLMADGEGHQRVQCFPLGNGSGKPDMATARLTNAGFCLHPQCGQINPVSCYCALTMSDEEKARYRAYETCTGYDNCAYCAD